MDAMKLDELCRDACVALGLDKPDALREEGVAEVDGIEMALRFDPEDDPNGLSFYVDLGLPAIEHRAQVCEELLKINLLHGTSTCAVYAMDGESGHAVSCLRFNDVEQMESEFLARMLRFYAEESQMARRMVQNPVERMFEPAQAPPDGPAAMNLA
jgi:hypothetical protein